MLFLFTFKMHSLSCAYEFDLVHLLSHFFRKIVIFMKILWQGQCCLYLSKIDFYLQSYNIFQVKFIKGDNTCMPKHF